MCASPSTISDYQIISSSEVCSGSPFPEHNPNEQDFMDERESKSGRVESQAAAVAVAARSLLLVCPFRWGALDIIQLHDECRSRTTCYSGRLLLNALLSTHGPTLEIACRHPQTCSAGPGQPSSHLAIIRQGIVRLNFFFYLPGQPDVHALTITRCKRR